MGKDDNIENNKIKENSFILFIKKKIDDLVVNKSNYIKLININNAFFSEFDYLKYMDNERKKFIEKKTFFIFNWVFKSCFFLNLLDKESINNYANNRFKAEIIKNLCLNPQVQELDRILICFKNNKHIKVDDLIFSLKNNIAIFYLYDNDYYDKRDIYKLLQYTKYLLTKYNKRGLKKSEQLLEKLVS